ncbi:hypothetical protein [Modestobacter versicolor]|uniref:hypothetical protein n=1 Tax=Modestobacter versicolor TaxID=429133 RepID=UPI0034DF8CC6
MPSLPRARVGSPRAAVPLRRPGRLHLHRFRRSGDDPFSSAVLYACRCGVVRPGP